MVEDIFDLSNDKLTIEDRVSIAKKVIKSLGFITFLDEAEKDGDSEDAAHLSEMEKDGKILLCRPLIGVEIKEEVIRIRNMPVWGLDEKDKDVFEKFYNILKEDLFTSFCIRDNRLEHSMVIPRISDEYFECYLRAVLIDANETFEYVRIAYNMYEKFGDN